MMVMLVTLEMFTGLLRMISDVMMMCDELLTLLRAYSSVQYGGFGSTRQEAVSLPLLFTVIIDPLERESNAIESTTCSKLTSISTLSLLPRMLNRKRTVT